MHAAVWQLANSVPRDTFSPHAVGICSQNRLSYKEATDYFNSVLKHNQQHFNL